MSGAAAPAEALRIFIGSSGKNRVEERVFIHSLRRHAARELAIHVFDGDRGTVRMPDGAECPVPGLASGAGGATRFSLARYAIPALCGFQGRALYCDSDQIVFGDIGALFELPLAGAAVAAVRVTEAICAEPYRAAVLEPLADSGEDYFLTSVMLVDCAAAARWDVAALRSGIDAGRLDYTGIMFLGRRERELLAIDVAAMPPQWNCLDALAPDSKLLHFTDLTSQPWLFPHNPTQNAWSAQLFAAVDAGAVSAEDLAVARRDGGIDLRTAVSARQPPSRRTGLHRWWTCAQYWARAYPLRLAWRDLGEGLVPQARWHWRKPTLLRRLGWRLRADHLARRSHPRRFVFALYSAACERVLLPVLSALAQRTRGQASVNVLLRGEREQRRRLAPVLRAAGCAVDASGAAVFEVLRRPQQALLVQALDHRLQYRHHGRGVRAADALRREGGRPVCLQHGGTRTDALASLASSAAQTVLVWGGLARRAVLVGRDETNVFETGNPLHDCVAQADPAAARRELEERHPQFMAAARGKRLVLLATTIQMEYAGHADEQVRYERFLRHIYASIDFARDALVIKPHPMDLKANRDLYSELLPPGLPAGSVLMVPTSAAPDVYRLMLACDVVLTRCSTVAEEALLVGRAVVSFDLDADGPAQGYAHLGKLGRYAAVLAEPADALRLALAQAPPPAERAADEVIRELTHALDGRSLERTVEALLQLNP